MDKRPVIFRADGNEKIGLGHVMRSLALVEILKQDFHCLFAIKSPSDALLATIQQVCPDVIEIGTDDEDVCFFEKLTGNEIVVIDGYNFTTTYKRKVKQMSYKLVLIEDEGKDYQSADMLINHGSDLVAGIYQEHAPSVLLLGFDYLIARLPFRLAAHRDRQITAVKDVFICMGGADPFNITLKSLKACMEVNFITTVNIIIGSGYKHKKSLEDFVKTHSGIKKIVVNENVSAEKLIDLVYESQIAICTSSSIALELCSVKIGLLTGVIADNQNIINENLLKKECAISIGNWNESDTKKITDLLNRLNDISLVNQMMHNQHLAIDGLSGERISEQFRKISVC